MRPSPRRRNKKAKWLSEEALKIAEKRSKRQRRKGKIYSSECRVPKNTKERLKKNQELTVAQVMNCLLLNSDLN